MPELQLQLELQFTIIPGGSLCIKVQCHLAICGSRIVLYFYVYVCIGVLAGVGVCECICREENRSEDDVVPASPPPKNDNHQTAESPLREIGYQKFVLMHQAVL